jgi:tripartite-type tricarboxylate transporter receptor subunit TctC
MHMIKRYSFMVAAAAIAAVLPATGVIAASSYPDRPVRLIVGFPPGGAADILARAAGQQLSERFGQQVVIDNRGGAGGLIATETAARGNPDGYTLLFSSIPHVINPHLYKKVSYDGIRSVVAGDDGERVD